jgi:hypothetical protein
MSPTSLQSSLLSEQVTSNPTIRVMHCTVLRRPQLTGNPGYYNINNGLIAQDTVTVQNVLSGGRLSFQGLFGCAEAYIKCTPANPDCFSQKTQCPAAGSSNINDLFNGGCPFSNLGIEAGWTFNVGGPPSAIAVPQQIYQAGLISKKVVSRFSSTHSTCLQLAPQHLLLSCAAAAAVAAAVTCLAVCLSPAAAEC